MRQRVPFECEGGGTPAFKRTGGTDDNDPHLHDLHRGDGKPSECKLGVSSSVEFLG